MYITILLYTNLVYPIFRIVDIEISFKDLELV